MLAWTLRAATDMPGSRAPTCGRHAAMWKRISEHLFERQKHVHDTPMNFPVSQIRPTLGLGLG